MYVPILRWKEGEIVALEKLFPSEKNALTPLLESIEYKDPIVQATELATRLGENPIFVDLSETAATVPSGSIYPGKVFFARCSHLRVNVIPTLRLKCGALYKDSVKEAARRDNLGVCIRILRKDIYKEDFQVGLESLVSYFGTTPQSIDLIIDMGIFNPLDHDIASLLLRIPLLDQWRTLTLASGAFPVDLANLEVGVRFLPRSEWVSWLDQVGGRLQRIPTYGDYATLHPVLRTFAIPPTPSCSIKYTTTRDWLIMRGRARKGGHSSEQYYGEAKFLIESEEWCGQFFSYGDSYIYETAQRKKGPGNPTNWLTVGANHHITFVVRQIAEQAGR